MLDSVCFLYLRGLGAGKSRLSDFKASIRVDLTLDDDELLAAAAADVCDGRCDGVELVVFSVAKIR